MIFTPEKLGFSVLFIMLTFVSFLIKLENFGGTSRKPGGGDGYNSFMMSRLYKDWIMSKKRDLQKP